MPTTPTLDPILTPYQHFMQLQEQGNLPNAQGALYEAIRRAGELARPRLQAALLLKLGRFYLDAQGGLQNAAHAFAAGGNLLLKDPKFEEDLKKAIEPLKEQEKQYLGSKDSLPDNYRPETQEGLLLAEKDPLLAVQLLVEGGNCLLELGQDMLALGMFEGALGVSVLKEDQILQAQVLTNAAEAHRRLGHLPLAETLLTQAQGLFEKTGNQADTKEFLAALATVRRDQGQWEEAARLFEQAVGLYRKSNDTQGYSRTLVRLAKLYLDRQEFAKARPHLAAALELGKQADDQSNLVFAFQGLARCCIGEGNPQAAIPYLEEGLQTLRSVVDEDIQTEQGKISRIAGMQWSLNALIDCYLAQMESSHPPENIAQAILQKIDELHGMILDTVIGGTISPFQKKERIEYPEALESGKQNRVVQTGRADYTRPKERVIAHPRREKIPPLTRVVYHQTDNNLVIACERPGEAPAIFSRPQSRLRLHEKVENLIRSLKVDNRARGEDVRGFILDPVESEGHTQTLLEELYQLLIRPVEALLPERDSILVIEPHDALHMVPFGVLMPSQGAYLCDRYAVLVSPSQETMHTLRSYQPYQSNLHSAKALIVGNPEMKREVEVEGKTYPQLAALPGAEQEASVIQHLFDKAKVTYLKNAEANEQAIQEAVRDSNVIHFATHGLAFEDHPMSSLLVVAGGNGYVTARTIRDWEMPADLVVLSACQTALGRLAETEGVIGLSRSFFIAGARTVVVSLWPVDDTATALLMEYFYQALFDGKNVPEALRAAKLKLKSEPAYAHPFYWAGFVVMGAEGI